VPTAIDFTIRELSQWERCMDFNLRIQGLGKIEELTLNIKPLTVIAGENSSGKTFATKSIYCVLEALNKNQLLSAFQEHASTFLRLVDRYEARLMPNIAKIDGDFIFDLVERVKKVFFDIGECLNGLSLLEHSKLETILCDHREQLLELSDSIHRYLNRRSSVAKIRNVKTHLENAADVLIKINESLNQNTKTVSNFIAKSLNDNFKKNYQVTSLSQLINVNKNDGAKIVLDNIGELQFGSRDTINFSFAAQGIHEIQSLEYVVFIDSPAYLRIRKGLQKFPLSFYRNSPLSRELKGYPEYIDNLYSYIDREYIDEPEQNFLELSKRLQQTIIGKLDVNKSGEIVYLDETGRPTPLSLAATGVSNLGLLDLLIRNSVIKKGSFLIIDEPEAHIHPKWQVVLMEVLYEMAQAGVNVIIATHSLDMLKKLEMLVKQNEAAEEIVAVHRMPESNLSENAPLLSKIEEALDDLSTPFYDMYMEDNF